MSINLGITKLTDIEPYNDIFAGLHPTMEVSEIVVLTGQNLKRGACLGLINAEANANNGKYILWDEDSDDGSEVLRGILGCDVDATSSDGKGFMYVHGEFLKAGLSAGHEIIPGVYNNGSIVIKEDK
ncbi:hypothetical protein MASR1M45_28270 [Candidatus Kapaibacterium sp.]